MLAWSKLYAAKMSTPKGRLKDISGQTLWEEAAQPGVSVPDACRLESIKTRPKGWAITGKAKELGTALTNDKIYATALTC